MLKSFREFWNEAMAIDEARWVVSAAGLVILVLISVYFVKLVRDMALGGGPGLDAGSSDYLTDFQKLRDEGKLDEEEYSRLAKSIPTARPDDADQTSK